MKKLFVLWLLCINMMHSIQAQGDCVAYGYYIDLQGFACGNDPGNICFVTSADWTNYNNCGGYVVELVYATGSFIYTDLDDFYLHSQTQSLTVLRHEPSFVSDGLTIGCLEGVIQVPNTVFTIRIVWPTDPSDILSTTTFTLDAATVIGAANQTTLLSDAIANLDLLPSAQAATQGQNIIIEGTLVIDENYAFGTSINGGMKNEILMAPGARIEVGTATQGFILGTLHTDIEGCDGNWDRILLRPNSVYNCLSTNIKDAAVAIELADQSSLNIGRAILSDNEIGIGTFGTTQKSVEINLFTSLFEGITIQNGTEGAHFENTDLITFWGNLRVQNMTDNGVYLDRTDFIGIDNSYFYCPLGINMATRNNLLSVDGCSFENGNAGVVSLGSAEMQVENSTFLNQLAGVVRASSVLNEHTLIQDNVMADCDNNILAIPFQSRAEIQFNELISELSNVSVWAIDGGLHKWAVQNNQSMVAGFSNDDGYNVRFLNVRDGRIFKNDYSVASHRNFEVQGGREAKIGYNVSILSFDDNIHLGASPAGLIYCNATDGNTGLAILNNNAGTVIRGNDFTGSGFNLSYGTPGNVLGHTGPQPYRGNMFDASTQTNPKAVNYGFLQNAMINEYTVGFSAGIQGTELYPFFDSADLLWFSKNENGNDYTCPPGLTGADTTITTIKEEIEAHIGLLSTNVTEHYGLEVDFDAKLKLFRALEALKQQGTLNTLEQVWYDSLETHSVASFIAFEQLYQTAGTLTPSGASTVEQLAIDIKALKDFMATIVWYTLSDTVAINTAKKAIYDGKIAELKSKNALLRDSLLGRHQLLMDALGTLNALNEGISTTETNSAQNLRITNRLMLRRLSAAFTGYTSLELDTLQALAAQCFGSGGEGVFRARALLAETTWSLGVYDDECIEGPDPEKIMPSNQVLAWQAFPNPAHDLVTLTLPDNHHWKTLVLQNILGREILRVQLTDGQRTTSLRTASLAPGLYLVAPLGEQENAIKIIVRH